MNISIGLPFAAVNPQFFELAIKSVFAQTFEDWELILVADGAPVELIDRVQAIDDSRVSLMVVRKRAGLATALNTIASRARHETLARMDSDDIMLPNRLRDSAAYLDDHPEIDVLATRAALIDEHGKLHGTLVEPAEVGNPARSVLRDAITHPTVIGRTRWFKAHPYSNEWTRTEDKQLWQTAPRSTQFAKLTEPLLAYRIPRRIDIGKILRTRREDRRLLRKYGPGSVGYIATGRGLAASVAGGLFLSTAAVSGQNRRVYGRKCELLDDRKADQIQRGLLSVRTQQVPGW